MPNYVTTSLPDYVQTNREMLIRDIVLGGDTIRRMAKQTGIKKDAYINLLDVAPTFQDGAGCGFEADGAATITQREIETGLIKVNLEICPETLRGKYAEYLINTSALRDGEGVPFEEYLMADLRRSIAEQMEIAVWNWDSNQTGEYFDGLLTIALADADVIDVTITASASAYQGIMEVYFALPEEVLAKGGSIFVSPAIYRLFIAELTEKNLFHFNPGNDNVNEYMIPGTNVKVVKAQGLANSLYILGTYERNMYFGCDLESDSEDIKVWWSDDDDVYKVKVKWNAGVQFAFPDLVVLGEFQSAPIAVPGVMDTLSTLATCACENLSTLADDDHVFKTKEQA